VTSAGLSALLGAFYTARVGLRARHVAGARRVSSYDFNNTYQYIVDREDRQIDWLRSALEGLGAGTPEPAPPLPVPEAPGRSGEGAVIADDARLARQFVDTWTPLVAGVTHARHRKMLEVILGETVEHERFFDEMRQGHDDLLGRRHANVGTGGGVLPTRWVE
jgi:hypothetical protein